MSAPREAEGEGQIHGIEVQVPILLKAFTVRDVVRAVFSEGLPVVADSGADNTHRHVAQSAHPPPHGDPSAMRRPRPPAQYLTMTSW